MSDLDLVMEAFKKAKTQGDTTNAKHFAQMAVDLEKQTPAPFAPSGSYLSMPPLDSSAPLPDASARSFWKESRDVPIQLGKGIFTGTRFLTDVFGADNPASQVLSGVEDWLDSLLSAQSKRDQQEVARIMKEAEDKGAGAQVLAGLKALSVAPVDFIVNAFGTSGPTLVAGLLAGIAGAPVMAVATGVGVLTGVGITKDAAYDAVFQELVSAGVSEADARETAKEAQAYSGENLDMIAFGGFLGGLAAKVGMEPKILTRLIGRRLAGDISEEGLKSAVKYGLIKEVSRTALAEALPEALQGGQEQFTRNLALQREGFDTPLGRGVVGAATLEGMVGAPVGAISALGSEGIKPRGTRLAEAETALVGMLETQEKEAEVRAAEKKITEEEKTELEKQLAPLQEVADTREAHKAAIAEELERDIDDPKVTEELEKREREWREKEAKRYPELRDVGPMDKGMQGWVEQAPDDVSKLTVKQKREWGITERVEKILINPTDLRAVNKIKAANAPGVFPSLFARSNAAKVLAGEMRLEPNDPKVMQEFEKRKRKLEKFYKIKKEALEDYQQNPFNYMGLDSSDLYTLTLEQAEVVSKWGWTALAEDKGVQFVDEEEYLGKEQLAATEAAFQATAGGLAEFKIVQDALQGLLGPEMQKEIEDGISLETQKGLEENELPPAQIQYLEDALEGLLGLELQQIAEGTLGPELQEAVEENKQRRQTALSGELGPEAQRKAEEYLEEIERKEQEVVTSEEEEEIELLAEAGLTDEERKVLGSFITEINKTQVGKTALEKRETLEEFLGSLTEGRLDEVLGGTRRGRVATQAATKLQLRETEAYGDYEAAIKQALANAEYTDKKDFINYLDAEKKGTVRREFPKLKKKYVRRIRIAKEIMDKVNAGIFKLKSIGKFIDIAKEKQDPSLPTMKDAEAEAIKEYYFVRSDKTPAFNPHDSAAVHTVSGKNLRGDARNLTGEERIQALAIQKYFLLEGVRASAPSDPETANLEMGMEELAIDLATVPKLVVDEIMEDPPRGFRSATSRLYVEAPPRAALEKETQNLQERGVFRGEEGAWTARGQKRIDNAVKWVESNLSGKQDTYLKARVKEIREEFKQDIIRSVREAQLDEEAKAKIERGKIAKKLEIGVTHPIVRRVFNKEITTDAAIDVLENEAEALRLVKEEILNAGVLPDRVAKLAEEFSNQDIDVKLKDQITMEALPIVRKELGDEWYGEPLKDRPVNPERLKRFNTRLIQEEAKIKNKLREEAVNQSSEDRAKAVAAFIETHGEAAITHIPAGDYTRWANAIEPPRTATGTQDIWKRSRKALEDARPVDPLIEEYAKTGNLNRTIEALLDSEPKELRPILRKLRERATGTRISITPTFDATGDEGLYFIDRKIIALDPKYGVNKRTFFHELAHAALDGPLSDINSKEVKAFFEFYSSIKVQMGDAYGGTDLHEFVSEFVSNSEFQNLLKTIKAPKSETFWVNILNTILEFFGIRKGQSAYNASFKFLDDILTAHPLIEANPVERIFLGSENPEIAVKEAIANLEPFHARRAKEVMEDIGGPRLTSLQTFAAGALRLDNLEQMYGDQLPGIKQIIEAVEKRQGEQEKDIEVLNKKYNNFHIVAHKYKAQYDMMGKMAIDMRLARVDIFAAAPDPSKVKDKKLKIKEEARLKAYKEGNAIYEKLNSTPAIQNMYKIMRRDFDRTYEEYVDLVLNSIQDTGLRAKIKERFDEEPAIAGYIPARRYGEFVLKYNDKDTDEPFAVRNFESASARDREIKALGLVLRPDIQAEVDADERAAAEAEAAGTEPPPQEIKKKKDDLKPNEYYTVNSIKDITQKSFPPEGFIKDLMDGVEEDGKKQGLTPRQIKAMSNTIYEAYVDLFPETSVTKSFKRSADIAGASEDILRVYGDTMVKWARKIADIKHNPAIQEGFQEVRRDAANYPNKKKPPSSPYDSTITAVGQNISDRETFTLNPTFHRLAAVATTGSYTWFMAGNLSTGVVNLSSIPLLTLPLLAAKFGAVKTANMLTRASAAALTANWQTNPKYKVLYDTLRDHAQLRHTLEREVLEGARQSTQEYTTWGAKTLSFLSKPISETEKYNRATTGMAAFDLAKGDGQSDEEAAQYALGIVKDVNTSGMASTAPKWMQNAPGRVMWTFKGFIWNSSYVVARSFVNTIKGETPAVKFEAFRQLLYMYGMSYAVGGLFGLPFAGAIGSLAQMVSALDDLVGDDEDEPFNFRAALKTMGGSELLLKGPLNTALNIEISNRASIANGIGFREDPYEVEKFGYLPSMALQLGGPMGSYAIDLADGLGFLARGEFERGFERLLPSFARNALKSTRYLEEGVRTRDGRPIDTDLSARTLYVQAFGFAPADVSWLYETRALAKNYENKVMRKRSSLLKARYLALTTGDTELYDRAMRRINNFRMLYPRLMSGGTLARSYKSRRAAESEYISGIRFNKNFLRNLDPFFAGLENINYYGLS